MMTEISLNILDVTENSIRAGAKIIIIDVLVRMDEDTLEVDIIDDGCGMDEKQLVAVTDPFFTTRTTRKVGLGVPFFKMAAELSGGVFSIESNKGKGTRVKAVFGLSNIDRMPLGDMTSTIHTLIVYNPNIDFIYTYRVDDRAFTLDTREFRQILGDVPFSEPEISEYIKSYLEENRIEVEDNNEIT